MKKQLIAALALVCATGNAAYADADTGRLEKKAKVKKEEAKAIALKSVPGTVIDCDIERRKKVLFWCIDVKPKDTAAKGLQKEVRVDANSGSVLSIKDDTEDEDDDDRD